MTLIEQIESQIRANGVVDIVALGGAQALWPASEELAQGPYFDALVAALVDGWEPELSTDARPFFLSGLRTQRAPNRLAGALEALLSSPGILDAMGPEFGSELLTRAETTRSDAREALLAAEALEGALRLAIGGYLNRLRVLGVLTDVRADEDVFLVRRVARLLGVANDYWPELGLVDALERLAPATGADADIAVELGLVHLRAALSTESGAAIPQELEAALERFETAGRIEEGRDDAVAFGLVARCLLDLASGRGATAIRAYLPCLRGTVLMAGLWHRGLHEGWLAARTSSAVDWLRLLSSIERAVANVDEASWYAPAEVLGQTLEVYSAVRSVRVVVRRSEIGAPGLAAIVRPLIESGFVRHEGLRAHLSRWLELEGSSGDNERTRAAVELQARLATPEAGQQPFRPWLS